jgi:hypothetical protein
VSEPEYLPKISSLSLQEFKDFFGISSVHEHADILSTGGLQLVNDSFISANMIITVFGNSAVLQNISPEYDRVRGLVYELFKTNLTLYTELLRMINRNIPKKHEIH